MSGGGELVQLGTSNYTAASPCEHLNPALALAALDAGALGCHKAEGESRMGDEVPPPPPLPAPANSLVEVEGGAGDELGGIKDDEA